MSGAVLDEVLDPLSLCLDEASARRVVNLRMTPSVQQRVDFLAKRANEGMLTSAERSEYEALINAADFISILKSKVRTRLATA